MPVSEDGSNTTLRNVGNYIPADTDTTHKTCILYEQFLSGGNDEKYFGPNYVSGPKYEQRPSEIETWIPSSRPRRWVSRPTTAISTTTSSNSSITDVPKGLLFSILQVAECCIVYHIGKTNNSNVSAHRHKLGGGDKCPPQ